MISAWLIAELSKFPSLPVVVTVGTKCGTSASCLSVRVVAGIQPECKCTDCKALVGQQVIEIWMD
jgi:hypothetical protein